MEEDGQCMGVDIYSSKTAAWVFRKSKWGEEVECNNPGFSNNQKSKLKNFSNKTHAW
jgi:hypothetical protein